LFDTITVGAAGCHRTTCVLTLDFDGLRVLTVQDDDRQKRGIKMVRPLAAVLLREAVSRTSFKGMPIAA
jgi:hypothetical protein